MKIPTWVMWAGVAGLAFLWWRQRPRSTRDQQRTGPAVQKFTFTPDVSARVTSGFDLRTRAAKAMRAGFTEPVMRSSAEQDTILQASLKS